MMQYSSRVDALLQRAHQLKAGVSMIRADQENLSLLATVERNQFNISLLDIKKELDTCESGAKPKVIGLAGGVSSGKSSFINQVLGAYVVSVDDGSTTAVPTRISFIPGNEYRATVHFLSIEDAKNNLREMCLGIPSLNEPPNNSPTHVALVNKLARFFNFGDKLVPPHPSTDAQLVPLCDTLNAEGAASGLFSLIGNVPQEFVSEDIDLLLKEIERFIKFDKKLKGVNALLPHVVKYICIEGPFDNVPFGVVLVDTPGLNDISIVNSQRSVDAIAEFDELWFVVDSSLRLTNTTDLAYLSNALKFINSERLAVKIVSTKIDGKARKDSDLEDNRVIIRDNLRNIFVADMKGVEIHQASLIKELTPEEKDEVALKLSRIAINFTGIPPKEYNMPPIGFEEWHKYLVDFGKERADNLTGLEQILAGVERSIAGLGIVHPDFVVPQEQFNEWRQNAHRSIEDLRDSVDPVNEDDNLFNRVYARGNWGRVTHWKVFEAIMSPAYGRRGNYFSPTHVGQVDVNLDIMHQWIYSTSHIVRRLSQTFLQLKHGLRRIMADWINPPPVATRLLQVEFRILDSDMRTIIDNCFLHTYRRVQDHFTQNGIYRYGCRHLPLRGETIEMFNVLGNTARGGLNAIIASIDNTTRKFLSLDNPVCNLPLPIRNALTVLLNADPALAVPDFDDIKCGITLDIFVEPVQTVCGHVFSRAGIERVLTGPSQSRCCPLCRASLSDPTLLPRRDIEASIRLHQQYQAYRVAGGEPVQIEAGGWWGPFWGACCDEYQVQVDKRNATTVDSPPEPCAEEGVDNVTVC